jgi:uncharacterized protein with NRDE domain
MCTLSFYPMQKGFILTSNRDVQVKRPAALPPEEVWVENRKLVFPLDPQGKGTWICADDRGKVWVLLNGARFNHLPEPPYRMSRGLLLLDPALHQDPDSFRKSASLAGIEPFTLVEASIYSLKVFRWDGKVREVEELDPGVSHIWSSSTLYTPQVAKAREQVFRDLVRWDSPLDREDLLEFHLASGNGNPVDDRILDFPSGQRTVSVSSLVIQPDYLQWLYLDLHDGPPSRKFFDLSYPMQTMV